tara:strand:- start:23 stop:961 length:939 start_codon:yes stop_codon:yes gene_type:complete
MPSPLQDLFGVNELQSESPLLSFPSNLGSENVQHYIMFTIKPTAPSSLTLDFMSLAGEVMESIGSSGETTAPSEDRFINIGDFSTGRENITRPTKDPEYVALYLPSVITNNQSAKYNDVEMGNVVSLLTRGVNVNNLTDLAKRFVANKAKQSAGAELSSLAGAYEIKAGKVTNNQIESVFETIDRRTFQFDFRMIPRNPREAKNIQSIVKKFRSNMAPSIPPDQSGQVNATFMTVPSLFEIEFISKGKRNNTLPKIQESICTTCNVNYGGERISLFSDNATEDGEFHPVETTMTLTFQEIPIITKEKIEDGF